MFYNFLRIISIIYIFSFCLPAFTNTENLLKDTIDKKVETNENIYKENAESQYILDSGDLIYLNFQIAKELNKNLFIGIDGFIYPNLIPRIKAAGLTINELKSILESKYKPILIDNSLTINIAKYRPVNVYINGEVNKPGLYQVTSILPSFEIEEDKNKYLSSSFNNDIKNNNISIYKFPTVYDALKSSGGITKNSNLTRIKIIRNNPKSNGGGKIETTINLMPLLLNGDLSQNIRLYDGDSIEVPRSKYNMKDLIIKAKRTNLQPKYISIYVTGDIESAGEIIVPYGSSLNQAIAIAGGKQFLTGKISFMRFDDSGVNKKFINYKPNAAIDSEQNPILMSGDIVNINKSLIRKSSEVISSFTNPFIGIYSFINLFD